MTRVLVNIRGTNGAGKTTLVKSLITENTEKIYEGKKIIATIFPEYNIIALGNYDINKKLGGCDLLKNQKEYYKVLDYICTNYPTHDIIMEGMMIHTFKGYYKKFIEINIKYNINPVIIYLTAPLNVCIERFINRNDPPGYTAELQTRKYNELIVNYNKFKEKTKIPLYTHDNSKYTINQSQKYLLKIIKDNKKRYKRLI